MDDPWANAWGEPSKSVLPEPSPIWSAPSVSALHGDQEDDLSTPSWPEEASSHWAAQGAADASIWGGTEASASASAAWNPEPSTFDKISLGVDSYPDLRTASFPPASNSVEPTVDVDWSATPSQQSVADEEPEAETPPQPADSRPPTPPAVIPPPISIPPLDDPDGFGSFATASTEETPAWTPSKPSFQIASADAATWGGGWEDPSSASVKSEQSDEEDEEDEWEAARRQKELQDRHVPPELLASILQKADEMSNALWGDKEPAADDGLDNIRHVDLDVLGLQAVSHKLIPEDLVLPMTVAFTKTFTSKQLSESLKLTRHSHISRASPMVKYMSSKGSISWEASVKARAELASDDVTPVGWKIVEQAPAESSVDDGKKKAGGFFSFFGRKATNASVDSIKRPASPASISGVPSIKTTASPRPSIDSARSSFATSNPVMGRSNSSSPIAIIPEVNPVTAQVPDPNSSSISATSPLSEISADGIHSEPTPPSAVSRFLGRFSGRNRRSASRDSLALSADDIEFLSDVPTAAPSNDGGEGSDLDALSLMLKAPPPPLATTSLPAPLPPPPKPAQLPQFPPPPKLPPPPAAPPIQPIQLPTPPPPPAPIAPVLVQMAINDDFVDFLDAPAVKPSLTVAPQPSKLSTNDPFSIFDAPPINPSPPRNLTPSVAPDPVPLHTTTDNDDDWAPFDLPAPQPTKPISRPPMTKPTPSPAQQAPGKRSFVPIMNLSRSSTPVDAKPSSTFSLPPPPTFSQSRSTPNGASSSLIAPLAPPPTVSRPPSIPLSTNFGLSEPTRISSSVSAPAVNQPQEDDDDFADFLSSPPAASNPSQPSSLSFNAFATSAPATAAPTVGPPPVVSGSKNNSSLDFSFLNPPPATAPSNPVAASPATGRKMSLPGMKPSLPSTRTQGGHVRKVSREADHARTQSLLDSAAARGRWLAPPSPIPEAIAPPPESGSLGLSPPKGSLRDGDSRMQAQQAQAVASFGSKSNRATLQPPPAWSFPAPPSTSTNGPKLQPSSLPPAALKATPTLAPQIPVSTFSPPTPLLSQGSMSTPSPSQSGTKSGGLSAQDLSFFEGL